MIKIRFCPPFTLEVSGHAGYAKKGEDIVCASVSALYWALVKSLEEEQKNGRGMMTVEGRKVSFNPRTEDDWAVITTIYVTVFRGLSLIAERYSEYAEVDDGHL